MQTAGRCQSKDGTRCRLNLRITSFVHSDYSTEKGKATVYKVSPRKPNHLAPPFYMLWLIVVL